MAEKKEIFRKVDGIINELNDQYHHLLQNQDDFNETELELIAASANLLSEQLKIIRKYKNTKEPASPEPASKDTGETSGMTKAGAEQTEEQKTAHKEAPVSIDEKAIADGKEAIHMDIKPEGLENKELRFSDEPAEGENGKIAEEKVNQKKQDVNSKKPLTEDQTVVNEIVIPERTISVDTPAADKITKGTEHVPTVNDVISAQMNQSTLAGNYSRQSVSDIKAIINLNDKLLFVKDLFNGYNLAYSEAIELLNRFDNFEAADNFLKNNYSIKNNWAEKQSTVDKFYEILNRRFTK